jgi:hypothetical protein
VIEDTDKGIRRTLNKKGKDVLKPGKCRWPQTFKVFADI